MGVLETLQGRFADLAPQRVFAPIIMGQSLIGAFAPKLYQQTHPQAWMSFNRGFAALQDPLLCDEGEAGSIWNLAVQELLHRGVFEAALLTLHAYAGLPTSACLPGTIFFENFLKQVDIRRELGLPITHVLWQQSQADIRAQVPAELYREQLTQIIHGWQKHIPEAEIIFAKDAYLEGQIYQDYLTIQEELIEKMGLTVGPDMNLLTQEYREDGCHYNSEGQIKAAELWAGSIQQSYLQKLPETVSIELLNSEKDTFIKTIESPRKLVWLASYPKSGNTWVRFVLSDLLVDGLENSQQIFEATPIAPQIQPQDLLEGRINLVKTHSAYDAQHPLSQHAVGAILIVRNPLKVLLSNLRYYYLTQGGLPEDAPSQMASIQNYLSNFVSHGGDPRWLPMGYGNWSFNTLSWVQQKQLPVLLIRYEDLIDNPLAGFQRMCQFAQLDYSPERIQEAIDTWDLQGMRALEEREIASQKRGMFYYPHFQRALDQGFRFVGKEGNPLRGVDLDQQSQKHARKAFEPAYSLCGYPHD